ncbi:MAG: hypothetical protein EP319_04740 [Deltaproteobacteria bacterium]|nr:MAG: hypothetical protein EP319_04740 [Deltaproteobacteria bacterium]
MSRKFKVFLLLSLLSISNAFAEHSQKDVIKGVFFGAGPIADKIDYIKKNYSLKSKITKSDLDRANDFVDKAAAEIIKNNPQFSSELTKAVNEKDLNEVLHSLERADTILTSFEQGREHKDKATVLVTAPVLVLDVALTQIAIVKSKDASENNLQELALRRFDTKDSILHREQLAMELVGDL